MIRGFYEKSSDEFLKKRMAFLLGSSSIFAIVTAADLRTTNLLNDLSMFAFDADPNFELELTMSHSSMVATLNILSISVVIEMLKEFSQEIFLFGKNADEKIYEKIASITREEFIADKTFSSEKKSLLKYIDQKEIEKDTENMTEDHQKKLFLLQQQDLCELAYWVKKFHFWSLTNSFTHNGKKRLNAQKKLGDLFLSYKKQFLDVLFIVCKALCLARGAFSFKETVETIFKDFISSKVYNLTLLDVNATSHQREALLSKFDEEGRLKLVQKQTVNVTSRQREALLLRQFEEEKREALLRQFEEEGRVELDVPKKEVDLFLGVRGDQIIECRNSNFSVESKIYIVWFYSKVARTSFSKISEMGTIVHIKYMENVHEAQLLSNLLKGIIKYLRFLVNDPSANQKQQQQEELYNDFSQIFQKTWLIQILRRFNPSEAATFLEPDGLSSYRASHLCEKRWKDLSKQKNIEDQDKSLLLPFKDMKTNLLLKDKVNGTFQERMRKESIRLREYIDNESISKELQEACDLVSYANICENIVVPKKRYQVLQQEMSKKEAHFFWDKDFPIAVLSQVQYMNKTYLQLVQSNWIVFSDDKCLSELKPLDDEYFIYNYDSQLNALNHSYGNFVMVKDNEYQCVNIGSTIEIAK